VGGNVNQTERNVGFIPASFFTSSLSLVGKVVMEESRANLEAVGEHRHFGTAKGTRTFSIRQAVDFENSLYIAAFMS
jgi:hypothetical protein